MAANTGIKKVLLDCVEGSLHANDGIRRGAEERLKAFEVTECYGTYLLEIVLEYTYSPPIRLLASVLLRPFVDAHWSKLSDKFVEPEMSESVKEMIKQKVPLALVETQRKIRKSVAAVISSIAHWDWPETSSADDHPSIIIITFSIYYLVLHHCCVYIYIFTFFMYFFKNSFYASDPRGIAFVNHIHT